MTHRYGVQTQVNLCGIAVGSVALEYNVLFALHFSRKSINLHNAS